MIIASHGPLASALLEAAEMICGATQGVTTVSLAPDDSPESFGDRLRSAIHAGQPTLILTDLTGFLILMPPLRRRLAVRIGSAVRRNRSA